MTSPAVKTLIDEQLEDAEGCDTEMTLIFTAPTWFEALAKARDAFIENVDAWTQRACLCNVWTVTYRVKLS